MKPNGYTRLRQIALAAALALMALLLIGAQSGQQRRFSSPAKAAAAMIRATQYGDMEELAMILGPDSKEFLSSGDPVADRNDRERVVRKYEEMNRLVIEPDESVVLYLGAENWPFPIPLTEKNGVWFFDTARGKEEILFRRIGRNENGTLDTLASLVEAQKEYASKARDGRPPQYAQKLLSDKGRQNGLYWETREGEPSSPIGSLVVEARDEGYGKPSAGAPVPFHGYVYRMLTSQGKDAPGGAMSYIVNGAMTRGFAFIAYPANYRNSGVMTFIVGKDGVIFQKDLGPDTTHVAGAITAFDPDKTWEIAE